MTTAAVGAGPPHLRTSPFRLRDLLDRRRSLAFFDRVAAAHPDAAELTIRGRRIWVVSDPALARRVLTADGRTVTKGDGLRVVRWVLGDGLLTQTDVARHRRNRRLIQPAFSAQRLGDYAGTMVAAAERTDARWSDGQVVAMSDEMARLTLDIVGRTLFGDDTDREAGEIAAALGVVLRNFGLGLAPGGERLMASRLPIAVRVRDAIATMRSTVTRIVDDHRGPAADQRDMVAALLAARDDGVALGDDELRDESLTLLLAGHETTANALTWTWWLLDRTPRVAARLRAELSDVLGGRVPGAADLDRLPYTTAVVAETLRLRPPAWILERETLEPLEVGAWTAPVGTTILALPWLLHRDPRSWGPDAAEFRPDRWLDEAGGFSATSPGQPRGAYLPFGAGSRICIGEQFAWNEAILALAALAQRWEPVTEPGQHVGTWAAVTLRPHPGITMRLRRLPGRW